MTESKKINSSVDGDPADSFDHSGRHRGWPLALLIGAAGAGSLAIGLVIWTGLVGGRAYGERAATDLAMPLGSLWLLLFAGAVASIWRGNRPLAAGFAIFWLILGIAFNGGVAGAFYDSLTYSTDSDPATALTSPLDAVVLLGGYARNNQFGVPELRHDGQRLMLAAQLWHAGKTKTVISTGTGHLGKGDPSAIGRELLVSIGVPGDAIFEIPGENTAAEMRGIREFLRSPPAAWLEVVSSPSGSDDDGRESVPPPRIGLVTSAMHMPRALRLAEGQELHFIAVPCCLGGAPPDRFNPKVFIPSAAAGQTFATALKEQLAALVGR